MINHVHPWQIVCSMENRIIEAAQQNPYGKNLPIWNFSDYDKVVFFFIPSLWYTYIGDVLTFSISLKLNKEESSTGKTIGAIELF